MVTKAMSVHKTPAELLEERRATLDYQQQANARRVAEQAERQRKADAFAQQAQQRREAWDRGELAPVERRNPLQVLDQAFRDRLAEHAVESRMQRRAIEASPEHQRLVADMLMPLPSAHREWVKANINDGHEPSPAEAFAQLQDAKQAHDRANKQLAAVQSRALSPAEVAYAQAAVETAKQAEQGALALFNELTRVPQEAQV